MARENQGLHYALIAFSMIAIILAVTTYIFCSQSIEAADKAEKLETELANKTTANQTIQAENNELKKMMLGAADAEEKTLEDITTQFNEDTETFSAGYDKVDKYYRPLLVHLHDLVNKKNVELTDANDALQARQDKYDALEKQMTAQEKTLNDKLVTAEKGLKDAEALYTSSLAELRAGKDKIQADLDKLREEKESGLTLATKERDAANDEVKKVTGQRERLAKELEDLEKETFEVPDGEIIWVDQRARMVWINLGRGDALRRQTTFSVYPIDTTNLAKAGKKAGIEVTRILGQDAEARIVDDAIADPIMVGDKIHTPVWSPGEQRRFALVGFMDLDKDGANDLQLVKGLIERSGGRVDCTIDEAGNQDGSEIGVDTRYLVRGEDADAKGLPASAKDYKTVMTEALNEADKYGMQVINYGDLLKQMGWKNQTPVVHFGREANPRDFAPKPAPGVVPLTSGSTTEDLFQPRSLPSRKPAPRGGAY